MLRITIQDKAEEMEIRLEGRIAGPWVVELDRVWVETAPLLASRKLTINLRNVTYADATGKQVLKEIYAQTNAVLVAGSPWTQFLAAEVAERDSDVVHEEKIDASNA